MSDLDGLLRETLKRHNGAVTANPELTQHLTDFKLTDLLAANLAKTCQLVFFRRKQGCEILPGTRLFLLEKGVIVLVSSILKELEQTEHLPTQVLSRLEPLFASKDLRIAVRWCSALLPMIRSNHLICRSNGKRKSRCHCQTFGDLVIERLAA